MARPEFRQLVTDFTVWKNRFNPSDSACGSSGGHIGTGIAFSPSAVVFCISITHPLLHTFIYLSTIRAV